MPYLIGAVLVIILVILIVSGIAWVVSALATTIAVPSILVLRPVDAMLAEVMPLVDVGDAMVVVYIVLHAALGGLFGWWLARRGDGNRGSDPPWPGGRPRQDTESAALDRGSRVSEPS